MEAPYCSETENSEAQQENAENPDLEDGEIEDDDDEEEISQEEPPSTQIKEAATPQILPAAIPADTSIFAQNDPAKEKRRRSTERKSDKHLTEAEKCVRMLHKMERAERERRERLRREQLQDDWAGNVEKAIASVLKKTASGGEEEEPEEEKSRGRKRKKRDRGRKKKHRKVESPTKNEEIDDDEMLNVRGGSPENKTQKEDSPFQEGEQGYESYDSEYDSEPYHNRNNKRNFDRDRKARNRNREARRERKNFREKNRKKEPEQNRLQMQDANSICMFYMQGKCHKGDECPYSHDALPPMKMELCKFYLMDCCAKRDKCLYMHSEFPCKYYHTGLKCFAKDNCKFAHGKPLSDSLKQILLKHLETAPKEILGDFPRLSREGAQHMVNQTQKNLELQYGIKPLINVNAQGEKTGIPSLFDINVPVPPELMLQLNTPVESDADNSKGKLTLSTTSSPEKASGDKPSKVRHTRWNDEPAVPLPLLGQAFAASAAAAAMPGMSSVFSSLTLQDQQKIHEYQLSYQMKGFYSEQDQDMRINSNGDVDMRAIPQLMSKDTSQPPMNNIPTLAALPAAVPALNFEQYKQDAGLTTNYIPGSGPGSGGVGESKMDTDIRSLTGSEPNLTIVEDKKKDDVSDSSGHFENSLTIDEIEGDSGSELPSNLPKKQRELFLRIQAQQKENIPENQASNSDTPTLKDDDWYSSDDDNDNLSKMVIHLEDEEKEEEKRQSPERILSPPTIKPVEVIDKLGDLSKIDISAEVTKLLTSIKSNQSPTAATSSPEIKKSRDPRQAKNLDSVADITSPGQSSHSHSDPRSKSSTTASSRRDSRDSNPRAGLSIYEQGIISPVQADSRAAAQDTGSKDVDLRNLDSLAKDLDMRPSFGDTDLRQGGGRQDVDLRQLGLPFKAMQNYTPATEIDASISSHTPITYRVHVVDIPRPDYTGLKLNPQDAQVTADPRLRKIFRVPSTEEKDSPASPKQQSSPPKITRQDPRKRKREESSNKSDGNNTMSYSQQLQLLQNSVFYQSLTSNQKLMLNQEIASKADQTITNDPILCGILSNLGLIPSLANSNGCAMNILANVNSLVPAMGSGMMGSNMPGNVGPIIPGMAHGMGSNMVQNVPQNMQQNIPQNMNPNMGGMGPNMMTPMNPNMPNQAMGPGITPNMGPGLLGPAPGMPLGGNMGQNLGQNNFQINFDPRNGGLLGQAPFENFPDNQNFQYNDEFYPNNDDGGNFQGGNNNNFNNPRNDRSFRNDRNSQGNNRRGRSWNNRHNNNRNYNRNNNNRNRSNRSYTPP